MYAHTIGSLLDLYGRRRTFRIAAVQFLLQAAKKWSEYLSAEQELRMERMVSIKKGTWSVLTATLLHVHQLVLHSAFDLGWPALRAACCAEE